MISFFVLFSDIVLDIFILPFCEVVVCNFTPFSALLHGFFALPHFPQTNR